MRITPYVLPSQDIHDAAGVSTQAIGRAALCLIGPVHGRARLGSRRSSSSRPARGTARPGTAGGAAAATPGARPPAPGTGGGRGPCRAARLAALGSAVLTLAVVPSGASAAIVEPPPMPHVFTVFPDRDFVSVEGYDPGERLSVRVLRHGVQIGAATGEAGEEGIFEVNHPGGFCWIGSTPALMAGDTVVVAPTGSPDDVGEATTTADVHASPALDDAGRIVIKGTARNADGSPMDLALIEQRIVNPGFR